MHNGYSYAYTLLIFSRALKKLFPYILPLLRLNTLAYQTTAKCMICSV